VTDLRKTYATLEPCSARAELLVHGEVTDPDVDVFDREAVFIDRVLRPLRRDFPAEDRLRAHHHQGRCAYVAEADACTAATITAHHLLYNRNAIFIGAAGRLPCVRTSIACRC